MKKLFLILLCFQHTCAIETLTKEYPELQTFLASAQFQDLLMDCELEVDVSNNSDLIAATQYMFDSNGLKKRLIFNSCHVNRAICDAEEFKFILCHELGHMHDKNLTRKIFPCMLGLPLGGLTTLFLTGKSLLKRNYGSSVKALMFGSATVTLGYLILMKLMRRGEFVADSYALQLTKNKDAAISILNKRKKEVKRRTPPYSLVQKWYDLCDDHPSEEDRIENIQRCIVE
jgi:hypothetical protein